MPRSCSIFGLFAFALFGQDQATISKMEIAGTKRFPQASVATASGLRVGGIGEKSALDAACEKLIRTGLFQACTYKYTPGSRNAIDVRMEVVEAAADQTARLTIPGIDESKLWSWLERNEPLVQKTMPGNDDAIQFYTVAVERYLRESNLQTELKPAINTNLETREVTLVFRPANLAQIVDVQFTGTSALDSAVLRKVLLRLAKGNGYTEYDFRPLLNENIRPLYLEKGYLRVEFPSVSSNPASGGVAITTTVQEGAVYKLGRVEMTGAEPDLLKAAQFISGETANWKKVEKNTEAMLQALRNQGYLHARSKIDTQFNESARLANLQIGLSKGEQFMFGKLSLKGVPAATEARLLPLWKLASGAPLDEGYTNEYITNAFKQGRLGPEYTGVAHQYTVRPGSNIVDVEITFRR